MMLLGSTALRDAIDAMEFATARGWMPAEDRR
jgi:hypothetical protein